MRFLLIIAIVGGIAYYTYSTWTTGKGFFAEKISDSASEAMQHPTSYFRKDKGKAAPDAIQAIPETPPVQLPPGPVAPPAPPVEPVISGSYRFQSRSLPAPAQIEQLTKLGLVVASDADSATVTFRGPASVVGMAGDFLHAQDVVGSGCGVRTWAVYVDRKVQKGWDITAAINAAAGVQSSLVFGSGGFTLDLGAGDLAAALDVIADGGSVEVLQRPHVSLSQGVTSVIESLQEVPIPSTVMSQGMAQTSVTYRKVGLELRVTPSFYDGGRVRLAVDQSNGLVGPNVEIGGGSVPVIETQKVSTTVELKVGQTVILGGVASDRVRTVHGLLRDTKETDKGALYVILSTFPLEKSGAGAIPPEIPLSPLLPEVPLTEKMQSPADWIDADLGILAAPFKAPKAFPCPEPSAVEDRKPRFARRR